MLSNKSIRWVLLIEITSCDGKDEGVFAGATQSRMRFRSIQTTQWRFSFVCQKFIKCSKIHGYVHVWRFTTTLAQQLSHFEIPMDALAETHRFRRTKKEFEHRSALIQFAWNVSVCMWNWMLLLFSTFHHTLSHSPLFTLYRSFIFLMCHESMYEYMCHCVRLSAYTHEIWMGASTVVWVPQLQGQAMRAYWMHTQHHRRYFFIYIHKWSPYFFAADFTQMPTSMCAMDTEANVRPNETKHHSIFIKTMKRKHTRGKILTNTKCLMTLFQRNAS